MNSISAIIIAKNAEGLIVESLKSVSFCNEMIVVDAGSSDRTIEVAKKMNAKVFEHKTQDFSQLRNFGLEKAKGEWVLYVDSDERVMEELRKSIESRIMPSPRAQAEGNHESGIGVYKIKRKNFYLGNNEWPYIERLERLFRRDNLKGWKGKLHESPVFEGEDLPAGRQVGELDGFLLHYTHRNLSSMLEKTIEWSKIEAELRLNANHPNMSWWRFPRVMITAFWEYYIKQGGWKVGTIGLIESIYQTFSAFITYARLWEIQNKRE